MCAPGLATGLVQSMHLSMCFASTPMRAAANDLAVLDQHTAHTRIRIGAEQTLLSQRQGLLHELLIGLVKFHRLCEPGRCGHITVCFNNDICLKSNAP